MELQTLGWGPSLEAAFEEVRAALGERGVVPGRVVRQESLLRIQLGGRQALARPAGRLLHDAAGAEALPVIGDWVAVSAPEGGGVGLIHAVLPRHSALLRRAADTDSEAQVIAANVDLVFVVSGLDAPLNPRRIERMLALVAQSGARPAIVLTKSDLAPDLGAAMRKATAIAPDVPVLVVSVPLDRGVRSLREEIRPGETAVLLGPSGVGKSTLTNALIGEAALATSEVREADRRGRHTTTHRQLFVLGGGGMIIDGPGLREFGLVGDEVAAKDAFSDIEALAQGCRFGDCTHQQEPGCAVRAAIERGELAPERLASFQKLERERAFQLSQQDASARRERRRTERLRSTAAWNLSRAKKKR